MSSIPLPANISSRLSETGQQAYIHALNIAAKIKVTRRMETLTQLKAGMYYLKLYYWYENVYTEECDRAGLKVTPLRTFMAEQNNHMHSKGYVSQLMRVARRYIVQYQLANFNQEGDIEDYNPLLLATGGYRLYKMLDYHQTPEEALEILQQAENYASRKDFEKWLAIHLEMRESEVNKHLAGVESEAEAIDEDDIPPFKYSLTVEAWEKNISSWDDLFSEVNFPDDDPKGAIYKITIERIFRPEYQKEEIHEQEH